MRIEETLDNQWELCPLAELYNGHHYCTVAGWPPQLSQGIASCCLKDEWRQCGSVMKKHLEAKGL